MSSTTYADIYYDPFDPVIDVDPHPMWKRMRDEQPLWWNERYEFWAISRFEDVWDAYHDTDTFSSTHGTMLEVMSAELMPVPIVIFMDPPDHESMRKLVSRAFTPKRISALEDYMRRLVDGYLDQYVGSSGFDFVQDFGALVPPMVIGEMLGVPDSEREQLRHWFDDFLHRDSDARELSPTAAAAIGEVYDLSSQLIADRRRHPGDDMVTTLIDAEVDDGAETRRLTDVEIAAFIVLLAGAGAETVARLLGWAGVTLARNPDQRALLVESPDLIKNAVDELLRHEAPSPVNGRWTLKPFSLHGVEVPAGSKVLLLNGSANRDGREFTDPDRFDVNRSIRRHITFGYGPHYCLGAALAKLEGRIALEGVLRRFPTWDINEDELVRVQTSTVRGFKSVPIHLPGRN
jgi:cytochrome P450